MKKLNITCGRNKNTERVWIEGSSNLPGWRPGDRFDAIFHDGGLIYQKNPAGKRKVSGKEVAAVTVESDSDLEILS